MLDCIAVHIVLALTLISLKSVPTKAGLPNRLRVCSRVESVEVTDAPCTRGWWIPEGIEPECVCATGTWFLQEQYCGNDFTLISGPAFGDNSGQEFTCFKINKQIRRVVSLSPQSKSYSHYIIQSNGKQMREMEKKSFFPAAGTPNVIIRLRANSEIYLVHKEGVQSDIWQRCLGQKRLRKAYTHIIETGESISYLKSIDEDELCDDVRDTDFPYERSNNTDWIINQAGSFGWNMRDGELPVNPCSCPPPKLHTSKTVTPRSSPTSDHIVIPEDQIRPDPLRNTDPDYDSLPGDSFNIYPKKRDPLVHAEHLTDNARTTASILSRLKDYVLSGVNPPAFSNPLFDYVRYGKRILTKLCPEIRPEVVGNLLGMFRLLLGNVIGKYPEEYSLNVDTAVHQRVVSSLDKCLKGINNRTVKFHWQPGSSNPMCQGKKNRIYMIETDGKSIPLRDKGLPAELRFVDGDVMLEVVFKVLLGTHYACSEYFEENPEDLSFMYVKTQEFLTIPYIMFRWENPAKGLTAAYRILNPMLYPAQLGEQIDACVFAAFDTSRFNTWLGRPTSEGEFIPKSVMQKSMDKLTGKSGLGGLTGEDDQDNGKSNRARNGMSSIMLNEKTGYCVHDFNDPLSWSEVENSESGVTGC